MSSFWGPSPTKIEAGGTSNTLKEDSWKVFFAQDGILDDDQKAKREDIIEKYSDVWSLKKLHLGD